MTAVPTNAGPLGVFGGAGPSVFTGAAVPEFPLLPSTAISPTGATMQPFGFFPTYQTISGVAPAALATANIALSQTGTSAVALVLTAGAGTTLSAGSIYLDGIPGVNPTTSPNTNAILSRAIRVISAGNDSSVTFNIVGLDLYGRVQTQALTGASVGTASTTKAFKAITSITPNANTGSTLTVGTTDTYGLPIRADEWGDILVVWNNTLITASTGFVAAVSTTPSGTTGDVRGTYSLETTASNGTILLNVMQAAKSFTNTGTLLGQTPA